MRRITALLVCVLCWMALTRPALYAEGNSQYVRPVAGCGHYGYDGNDSLIISNTCDIDITVTFSSAGDVWGTKHLGPSEAQYSGWGHKEVDRSGGSIDVYACPGNSTPQRPDGRSIMGHYRGEYICHR